ncbi:MAG: glucose-6-phosphate dehydrogenase assembly protein OpcA [Roseiflexus sp.]|nr:glucose-6-phosphate dehydrogenase assembly protein OpcA [Roseiflexus sp.]MDW8147844.1 glucose-6-phosphate dehydrogenase assembly protein OpcA [Roseiflexaceae bacterium]MDW8233721.1 glucose-6-phosphate dehydrogenase assembly protein OpcA [Roseiflexaceae bacterium]
MTDIITTPSVVLPQVDACAIERELARLWSAATKADTTGDAALMRACLFNFVVLTDTAHFARITDIVARVTALRPNRAIVAALSRGEEPAVRPRRLEAWVRAHCTFIAPGRPQVCGEQISIIAPPDAEMHIPGIVLSLLEPDVPVVIWWTFERTPGDAVLAQLQSIADRLILDTARMDDATEALHAAQTLIAAGAAISDLAWGRLTVWREQIAQLFDAPPALHRLWSLERIVIEHGPHGVTAALLLAGWIATRLGWRLSGRRNTGTTLRRSDGGAVLLEFATVETSTADRLASVTLLTADSRFTVAHGASGDHLTASAVIDNLTPVERAVHLPPLDTAALIVDELNLARHDPIYEAALRQALEFAAHSIMPSPE